MTNRSTRVRSGKKSRLRYLSLSFDTNSNTKENLENGKRPHGGFKGEKKHPLSPYSYNRDQQYHQDIQEDIDKLFREEFIEQHGSPEWVLEANRDVTHTDQSPLMVNKLLSPNKQSNNEEMHLENLGRLSGRRSAPLTRRSDTSYYRPNSTHQYLSSTDTRHSVENGYDIRYGRPTRTTLLRARQRSNSTPINAYEARRESTRRIESPSPMYSSREMINVSNPGESRHSFLTGARYNRAHYLDAKSLSVYGVYMPRHNPHACFMTGHSSSRIKDGGEVPAAPPDSPRSDTEDLSLPLNLKRPATAPGKRLLISTAPPSGRPKSAWGDATTTCNITQNERSRVVVTIKGSKSLSLSESKLPRVKGISVPRLTHNSARDPVDETSLVNQPPPTPVGGLSLNGDHEEHAVSLSVKHDSLSRELNKINEPENGGNLDQINQINHNQNDNPTILNTEKEVANENEADACADSSNQQIINIPTEKDLPKQESIDKQDISEENKENENTENDKLDVNFKEDVQKSDIDVENSEKTVQQCDISENVEKTGSSEQTFFITEKNESSDLDTTVKPEEYSETEQIQTQSLEKTKDENDTSTKNNSIHLDDSNKEEIDIDHSIKVSIEEKIPKQDT